MKHFLICCSFFFSYSLYAQNSSLPVTLLTSADTSKPFVFYISGDGGWNNFSSSLAGAINKNGFTVAGLNAKSYFWEKKTPERTVLDIIAYLQKKFAERKNHQWVLTGYSFGADIIPFIVNKLPDTIRKRLITIVLLSPSTSTDFEVHWAELLGWNKRRSMDVVAEINKMGLQKTAIISADDDNSLPVKEIRLKNCVHENLPGGHHFENNTGELAKTMIKYFR
jgi:type IV secretory pathway VirJ component